MNTVFPRALHSLEADSGRCMIVTWLAAALLLGVWIAWACGARLTIYAVTEAARLEVSRAVHVVETPVAGRLGKIVSLRPGAFVEAGDILAAVVPSGALRIVADFLPPAALGRIRPAQPARLRLVSYPWTQYGSVAAVVTNVASEAYNGRVRVELQVVPDATARIPLPHGLTGALEIAVERLTPLTFVLRNAGQRLARSIPTTAQNENGIR